MSVQSPRALAAYPPACPGPGLLRIGLHRKITNIFLSVSKSAEKHKFFQVADFLYLCGAVHIESHL